MLMNVITYYVYEDDGFWYFYDAKGELNSYPKDLWDKQSVEADVWHMRDYY